MKSKYLLKFSLILLLIITACDDFLETAPRDAYGDRAFFVDATTADLAVTAIYNALGGGFSGRYWAGEGNNLEQQSSLFGYIGSEIYLGAWRGINDANVALRYLPEIDFEGNEDLKKRLIAEIRALRAFFYYTLSIYLGPVPMIDRVLTYEEYSTVERPREVSVTRDFITSELLEAIPDLPAKGAAAKGRVSKDFARFYAAQILMADKNWVEAEKLLRDIILSEDYSLLPEYGNLVSYDTQRGVCDPFEYSVESIFEVSVIEGLVGFSVDYMDRQTPINCSGDDWRSLEYRMNLNYYERVFLIEQNTVSYTADQDTMWINRETGEWIDTPAGSTVNMPVYNDDPRRVHTVLTFGDIMICPFQPDYYVFLDNTWFSDAATSFIKRKYWPTSDVQFSGRRGNNYLFARYAHVLLDYSEVQYRLGNTDLAYDYMNEVRERAWTGYPRSLWERKESEILFPDATWNQVVYPTLLAKGHEKPFIDLIHEYFLEFANEGLIAPLLMRWGIRADLAEAFEYAPTSIYPERIYYGYPVSEIEKNPNIWQNVGFN